MPKSKGLLLVTVILILVFAGAGCGMLAAGDEELVEADVTGEGKLPQWLLAEHRGVGIAEAAEDEDLMLKDNDDEETEEPVEETAEPEPVEEATETQPAETAPPPPQQDTSGSGDSADQTPSQPEPETENVTNRDWQGGTYTGAWENGRPNGRGTFNHPSGAQLTGTWVNGNPDGQFSLIDANGNTTRVTFDMGQIVEEASGSDWWSPDSGGSGGSWFQ